MVMKVDRNMITSLEHGQRKNNFEMSLSEISDGIANEEHVNIAEELEDHTSVSPAALPRLSWSAAVKSSVRVKENGRTCEEYMRLPASECIYLILVSYEFDSYLSLADCSAYAF